MLGNGKNAELAEYCRSKGLYIEQVAAWRSVCMGANANIKEQEKTVTIESKKDKKPINQLEKELRRKGKALAETAELLVLRKKQMRSGGKLRTNDP